MQTFKRLSERETVRVEQLRQVLKSIKSKSKVLKLDGDIKTKDEWANAEQAFVTNKNYRKERNYIKFLTENSFLRFAEIKTTENRNIKSKTGKVKTMIVPRIKSYVRVAKEI